MANTEFFVEAAKDHSSITWKDIFSESFAKHTKADMEYAMQTGTVARQVPESNMLETWNRPWLWWSAAKWGLGLIAVQYIIFFFCMLVLGVTTNSMFNMLAIVPPLVIPLVIMVFMWELNIPQNISLMDMLGFFLAAGILNFAGNALMYTVVTGEHASLAALREEPAKLMASLAILLYMQKVQKKKIYGLTGLAVGAVVGAAFSGIESVSYAFNAYDATGSVLGLIFIQVLRSVMALGGHFAYCIPYTTAIALNAKDGKITLLSLFHPMTVGAFLFAVACHALWNSGQGLLVQLVLLAVSTVVLLYWVKKSLKQIVRICGPKKSSGRYVNAGPVGMRRLKVCCNTTSLQGTCREITEDVLMIGRQKNLCGLCFDSNTPGVSRQHCKIFTAQGRWYIQDLNSTYGTYVQGKRLMALAVCEVQPGTEIYLGSRQVWLTIR